MKPSSPLRLARAGTLAARILAGSIASLLAARSASAGNRTWDNASADFLWANELNWDGSDPGNGIPGTSDTAIFGAAGVGTVDLGGLTRTISALSLQAVGYTISNGSLSLNTINNTFANGTIPVISANVTDQGSAGLTINQSTGDCSGFTINGQIAIANTGATALQIVGNTQRTGVYTLGSTTLANSVAGGVSINSRLNGGVSFQGAWTISGNLQMINGSSNDNAGTTNLKGAINIAGDLISAPTAGNSATPCGIDIFAGSDVRITGNLLLQGPATFAPSIRILQPARLGGTITVANGTLGVSVTDPFLNLGTGAADTSKVVSLGGTHGSLNAAVSMNSNAKTLNNPITVESGSPGQAILASTATGTGIPNKVTYAGLVTLNKALSVNASNTAGAILDITGKITGSQPVWINTGSQVGTVALGSSSNDYSGGTIVDGGLLQINALGALGGSGRNVTVQAPAVVNLGYTPGATIQTDLLSRIISSSTGAFALAANSNENFDFSGAGNNFTALSLGAVGSVTYTGTLTPNGTTYRLGGGGGTLVFNPAAYTSGNDLVINGNGLAVTVDFAAATKAFGAVTLAGGSVQNGTLTGTSFSGRSGTISGITVLDGTGAAMTKTTAGTLTLSGSAVHTFQGGLAINAGTLLENFANLTTPTDLIDSANVLTLGGGILSLAGKNSTASSQTFASTTLSANRGSKITLVAGSGTASMTVGLGAITRTIGSTLNFSNVPGAGPNGIIATTTTANTNDILGPWATVGSGSGNSGAAVFYATNNGAAPANQIVSYTGAAVATQPADLTSPTTNYSLNLTAATNVTLAAPITANTLRTSSDGSANSNGIGALTLANGGNLITLNGLLVAAKNSNDGVTISGSGQLMIGTSKDLILISGGKQAITISAPIVNYDPGTGPEAAAVTYNGFADDNDFKLTLSGTNTYSGGTTVNAGRLYVGNTSGLGTGAVTINNGARLVNGTGALSNNVTLNGGNLFAGNGWNTGVITLAADSQIGAGDYHAFPSANQISSNITGPGGLTTAAGGGSNVPNVFMLLSGTNDYAGPTIISTGGIQFKSPASLYNGDTSKWTPANISVNNGCTLALSIGGAGEFTGAQAGTLITNLTTAVNNNGLKAGSIVYLDPRYANGTPVEISSAITDSTGPGGGLVNLTIGQSDGSPTNTVVLSGANTYSGQTSIDRYMAVNLSVSSFNSVFTNPSLGTVHSASSSLGAPTTMANGTINLKTEVRDVALIYTGSGETTDRVINYGSSNGNLTLDQAGGGLLKFVNSITGNTGRSLTLQGSTTGAGEIAAVIGTNFGSGVTKNGTGTWTLSGANTYAGTTSVSRGTLAGTQIGGTPFGTGAMTVSAAVLSLAPSGTGAEVSVTGSAATSGAVFTFNADAVLSLDRGSQNSLTYTVGGGTTAAFARGTNGTLILSAGNSTKLGQTAANNGERFLINGTAPAMVNGLVSGVAGQDRANNNAGDFLTYDVTDGFKPATYTLTDDFTGSTNTSVVSIANPTVTGGTTFAYALKVGATSLTNTGNTITLGGSATGVAGLILNGGSINGGTLTTPTGVATEFTVYVGTAGGSISGNVNTATSQAGMSVFGPGALTVSSPNSFTGGLRVNNSTVIASNDNQLGGTTSAITLTGGTLQTSGTFALGTTAQRAITLNAGQDQTGGTFEVTGGITTFTNSSTGSKVVTGSGSLTKTGAGTLVLAGNTANSYTGGTSVNDGTLLVNNTTGSGTGSGPVSVSTGATLGGVGTIGGSTTIEGIHSPGSSAGLQTFTNGLAYASTSTLLWELMANTDSGRGTDFDAVDVTGSAFSITSGAKLDLGFSGTVSFVDSFWNTAHTWMIADLGSGLTGDGGSDLFTLGPITGGSYSTSEGTFSVTRVADGNLKNDVVLNWTASTGSPYQTWINGYPTIPVGDRDPEDDYDNDGVTNLAEFAFKGVPNDASNRGLFFNQAKDSGDVDSDKELTFTCAVRRSAVNFAANGNNAQESVSPIDEVTYTIEGSTTLTGTWNSVVSYVGKSDTAPSGSGLPSLAATDWEYRTFSAFNSMANKGFLRTKVVK
jgi:autotransporter-associated beta strand protein